MGSGRSRRDGWVLALGALIVAAGVGLALWNDAPPDENPIEGTQPGTTVRPNPVQDSHGQSPEAPTPSGPRLIKLLGEVAQGGLFAPSGQVAPFVIGHMVELDVEAAGVDRFRWSCNGKPLLDEGAEWSARSKRIVEFTEAIPHHFKVEARDEASGQTAEPLEKEVAVKVLEIVGFEVVPDLFTDRCLIGDTVFLEATMAEPISPVTYEYRFSVNGQVILNETDGVEWSEWGSATYEFAEGGSFLFKVEVRRQGMKAAEASKLLAAPLVAGAAVIDEFQLDPPQAAAGMAVNLVGILNSTTDEPEVRIGIQDLQGVEQATGFTWLPDTQSGQIWSLAGLRTWTPARAGDYRIRIEIRPKKDQPASDFREVLYVVRGNQADF